MAAAQGILRLTLALQGVGTVTTALSRFGEDVDDWRPFFRDDLAPAFFADVQKQFDSEGQYTGGWAPLSQRYAEWKHRHYPGTRILERTGRLKRSFDPDDPNADQVLRVTKASVELGSRTPYAGYHLFGTARLPARPMIWLASSETWGRRLHAYLVRRMRERGL